MWGNSATFTETRILVLLSEQYERDGPDLHFRNNSQTKFLARFRVQKTQIAMLHVRLSLPTEFPDKAEAKRIRIGLLQVLLLVVQ